MDIERIVREELAAAPRGTGGLKRCRSGYFAKLANETKAEILNQLGEPVVMTSEGVDKWVTMSLEQYFAIIGATVNGKRMPRMVRVQGVLYRECV